MNVTLLDWWATEDVLKNMQYFSSFIRILGMWEVGKTDSAFSATYTVCLYMHLCTTSSHAAPQWMKSSRCPHKSRSWWMDFIRRLEVLGLIKVCYSIFGNGWKQCWKQSCCIYNWCWSCLPGTCGNGSASVFHGEVDGWESCPVEAQQGIVTSLKRTLLSLHLVLVVQAPSQETAEHLS